MEPFGLVGCYMSEIDEIVKELNKRETNTRQCADIWSLGIIGSEADKATKEIIKILYSDENWRVRTWAAWSLGRIGGKRARKALEKIIKKEENEIVQFEAESALERLENSLEFQEREHELMRNED
jgi:HEAT repeat protein